MSKTLYHNSYDPASYGRSYVRMSIETPELYWNGNEWVRFEDKIGDNNHSKSNPGRRNRYGMLLLKILLVISIALVIFMIYMFCN